MKILILLLGITEHIKLKELKIIKMIKVNPLIPELTEGITAAQDRFRTASGRTRAGFLK